jgi:hypothetical protein
MPVNGRQAILFQSYNSPIMVPARHYIYMDSLTDLDHIEPIQIVRSAKTLKSCRDGSWSRCGEALVHNLSSDPNNEPLNAVIAIRFIASFSQSLATGVINEGVCGVVTKVSRIARRAMRRRRQRGRLVRLGSSRRRMRCIWRIRMVVCCCLRRIWSRTRRTIFRQVRAGAESDHREVHWSWGAAAADWPCA